MDEVVHAESTATEYDQRAPTGSGLNIRYADVSIRARRGNEVVYRLGTFFLGEARSSHTQLRIRPRVGWHVP